MYEDNGVIVFYYEIEEYKDNELIFEYYTTSNKKKRQRAILIKKEGYYELLGLPSYIIYNNSIHRIKNHSFINRDKIVNKEEWFGITFISYIRNPYNIEKLDNIVELYKEKLTIKRQLTLEYLKIEENCLTRVIKNKKDYNFINLIIFGEPINISLQSKGEPNYVIKNSFNSGQYFSSNLKNHLEILFKV